MVTFKGVTVRKALNGCGVDKLCPLTDAWSVLFTSMLTISESNELKSILNTGE
jgi:hypothetical protein